MSAPTLIGLLCRWEESLKQGRELSIEELCPNDPDLAAELLRHGFFT